MGATGHLAWSRAYAIRQERRLPALQPGWLWLRDSRNQLRSLRRRSRPQTPRGGSLILRAAEAEDREENNRQQKQTNPKAHSFPKTLSQVDDKNDQDYEINERN